MFVSVVREDVNDPASDYVVMIGTTRVDLPPSSFAVADGFAKRIEDQLTNAIKEIKDSIPDPAGPGVP